MPSEVGTGVGLVQRRDLSPWLRIYYRINPLPRQVLPSLLTDRLKPPVRLLLSVAPGIVREPIAVNLSHGLDGLYDVVLGSTVFLISPEHLLISVAPGRVREPSAVKLPHGLDGL